MSNETKSETAPAATGTASEPKNPTVKVKPQESGQSVVVPDDGRKPSQERQRDSDPDDAHHAPVQSAHEREYKAMLKEHDAAWRQQYFEHDDRPMLSQKGNYPTRFGGCLIESKWDWYVRSDLRVSPWLNDWETSLARADWTVIRKRRWETNDLPHGMDTSRPEDADLYSPELGIYLSLLPSKIPLAGSVIDLLNSIRDSYPESLVIMHARKLRRHFFQAKDADRTINLLSAKNTARCIQLGGLVEFQGMLYEPEGPRTKTVIRLGSRRSTRWRWRFIISIGRTASITIATRTHGIAR